VKVGDLVRFKRDHTFGVPPDEIRWRETAIGLVVKLTERGRMTCALWSGRTKPEFYYTKDLEVVCESR